MVRPARTLHGVVEWCASMTHSEGAGCLAAREKDNWEVEEQSRRRGQRFRRHFQIGKKVQGDDVFDGCKCVGKGIGIAVGRKEEGYEEADEYENKTGKRWDIILADLQLILALGVLYWAVVQNSR